MKKLSNVGLGVTPSADWHEKAVAMQVGPVGALIGSDIGGQHTMSGEQVVLGCGFVIKPDPPSVFGKWVNVGNNLKSTFISQHDGQIGFAFGEAQAAGGDISIGYRIRMDEEYGFTIELPTAFYRSADFRNRITLNNVAYKTVTGSSGTPTLVTDITEANIVKLTAQDENMYATLDDGVNGQRLVVLNTSDYSINVTNGDTYIWVGKGCDFIYIDSKWYPLG